jgi:hydroxyacylglutathione hydrolase
MQIQQIKLRTMDIFCYLVADPQSRACALIDPAFESKRVLGIVAEAGYRVTYIINTHYHADHTAGNGAIKSATGAAIAIHRLDAESLTAFTNKGFTLALGGRGSPIADRLVDDGDQIEIGAGALSVIHTPGHTAGGICLYTKGHLFTGDTLFVGAVGRTDLSDGSHRQLMQSIGQRLYTLPPETIVWPGHDYGRRPSSTIGEEKATNPYTRRARSMTP